MKYLIALICLLFVPAIANAQCIRISELVASAIDTYNNALFWRYADKGDIEFLIVTPRIQDNYEKNAVYNLPWKLYMADEHQACLAGSGDSFQRLKSVEYLDTERKYGLPGSGYRRCSARDDPIGAVRLWANIEIGDSYVYVFSNRHGKKTNLDNPTDTQYTVVQAKSLGGWIILKKVKRETCYKNRGNYWDFVEK